MRTMLFSPSDISHATSGRITPDILRHLRSRKLLDDIGHLKTDGKWGYNTGEIIMFAIAAELSAATPIGPALDIAKHALPCVDAHYEKLRGRKVALKDYLKCRFMVGRFIEGRPVQPDFFHDLNKAPSPIDSPSSDFAVMLVVDCAKMAKRLAEKLDQVSALRGRAGA